MRKLSIFLFAFLQISILSSYAAETHRVFTFGNLAEISSNSPFLDQLEKLLDIEEEYTVLITGDLINEDASKGLPESEFNRLKRILSICQHSEKSKVIIVPGDRDWDSSGENGLKSVKALQKLVEEMDLERVSWAISKGCPGPKAIELSEELVLIGLNTQWWNHPFDRPSPSDGDCKTITSTDIHNELSSAVEEAEGKNVLIAGHYPLLSAGRYGGYSSFKDHVSPPIYGSIKAAFHQNIGSAKDIHNERFDHIRKQLLKVLKESGSIIYASGHEHNVQLLESEGSYLVNSGSPTYPDHVGPERDNVLLAEAKPGIVELRYHPDGKVDCIFHESMEGGDLIEQRHTALFTSACSEHGIRHNSNTHFVPCVHVHDDNTGNTSAIKMTKEGAKNDDHTGGDYRAGGFKQFMLGKHYRSSWVENINAPYLNLEKERDGLNVYAKGGGRQTTSLKMKGGDGREYVFRSVDKEPTRILSSSLKSTIVSRILQDATSQQHPYGAMAACRMLDETSILHASPSLFILPDNPSLGPFRKDYAGLFGMLEEKPINPKNVEKPFADADEILQSYKMIREQYNDHDHRIDYKEYARARIFDILIGDWGRHQDNWKWAGFETEDGMLYRPIPRDRDHVFSKWDGLLPYLADRKWGKASGEHFDYEINDIRSLTWQTRHSDRFWLNEANRQDWIEAANYIQENIDDVVIDASVRTMPQEVLELSGLEIAEKLKQRRADLQKYAESYYELISKEVDVVGSNKKERFVAVRNNDGTVTVSVYASPKQNSKEIYQRTFHPKETKEIRLYGLGGNDSFEISGESEKSIRIRIIGGPGEDDVQENSVVKKGSKNTLVYEHNKESKIDLGQEGKQVHDTYSELYNYDRTRFAYNRYGPIAAIGFNSTSGFGITGGLTFTNQRFGKPDFSSKHSILGKLSTEGIALFKYKGSYRHVLGKWDLELAAGAANLNEFLRFYGIGNGVSLFDEEGELKYFEPELRTKEFSIGLSREFWKRSRIELGVHYENNSTDEDPDDPQTILPPGTPGIEDANLAEIVAKLDIDFRDRASFAERGMRLALEHRQGVNTALDDESYFIVQGSLENHSTFNVIGPWTLSLKANASTSSGIDVIPFYHRVYIGQNSNLRGYDNNRFTGKSTLAFNSELRIPFGSIKNSFLPLSYGFKVFYDTGRAFSDVDVHDDFAQGYGIGIYLIPISKSIAINISVAHSDEESALVLFSVGTNFK